MEKALHVDIEGLCRGLVLPQSYALLLSGSPEAPSPKLLRSCLAGASLTMAIDSGANPLAREHLPIDILVGDLDSISPQASEYARSIGCRVIKVPAEKDFTDIELAFSEASSVGVRDVVVLGALGARLDHELAALGACSRASQDLGVMVLSDSTAAIFLSADGPRSSLDVSCLGLPARREFSVIAFTDAIVSERGTYYEIDQYPIKAFDGLGISNYAIDGNARITVLRGDVAVIASAHVQPAS